MVACDDSMGDGIWLHGMIVWMMVCDDCIWLHVMVPCDDGIWLHVMVACDDGI